jgi:hypothetical protein
VGSNVTTVFVDDSDAGIRGRISNEHAKIVELGKNARPSLPDGPPLVSLFPLFKFDESNRAESLSKWERIDDVIMGGVSSSSLISEDDKAKCAVFRGIVREEGGGFCGQRTKLFEKPLDLSAYDGLYLTCRGDDNAHRRIWKMNVRAKQDRGEVIYSTELPALPKGSMETVQVPFDRLNLVRGPRLVAGAPPLNASAIFQISITCTKFHVSTDGSTFSDFLPGPFRLEIEEVGAWSRAPVADAIAVPELEPSAKAKQSRPLLLRALKPLSDFVFSEKARRRNLAFQKLLNPRGPLDRQSGLGLTRLQAARWGWQFKVASARAVESPFPAPARALVAVSKQSASSLLRALLTIPLQLLFKAVFASAAFSKKITLALRTGEKGSRKTALILPALK